MKEVNEGMSILVREGDIEQARAELDNREEIIKKQEEAIKKNFGRYFDNQGLQRFGVVLLLIGALLLVVCKDGIERLLFSMNFIDVYLAEKITYLTAAAYAVSGYLVIYAVRIIKRLIVMKEANYHIRRFDELQRYLVACRDKIEDTARVTIPGFVEAGNRELPAGRNIDMEIKKYIQEAKQYGELKNGAIEVISKPFYFASAILFNVTFVKIMKAVVIDDSLIPVIDNNAIFNSQDMALMYSISAVLLFVAVQVAGFCGCFKEELVLYIVSLLCGLCAMGIMFLLAWAITLICYLIAVALGALAAGGMILLIIIILFILFGASS